MLVKFQDTAEVYDKKGELAALRYAAKLNCLGDSKDAIQKAVSAKANPDFYREIGKDPEELYAAGVAALLRLIEREPKP